MLVTDLPQRFRIHVVNLKEEIYLTTDQRTLFFNFAELTPLAVLLAKTILSPFGEKAAMLIASNCGIRTPWDAAGLK